jgi:hypothetical protein
MKSPVLSGKLISQCPSCGDVAVKLDDKRVWMQSSIAVFEKLPKIKCMSCQIKTGKDGN